MTGLDTVAYCRVVLLAIVLSLLPISATSQGVKTVQDGLIQCRAALAMQDTLGSGICMGVADGVMSTLKLNCGSVGRGYNPLIKAEIPPSIGSAVQAFVNWAERNPQDWGQMFAVGMASALIETFPCEQ